MSSDPTLEVHYTQYTSRNQPCLIYMFLQKSVDNEAFSFIFQFI